MSAEAFSLRAAAEDDRHPMALLYAAVAEEGDRIGGEAPVDLETRAAQWDLERTFVAVARAGEVVGLISISDGGQGIGEIGMMVAAAWRGRGVGGALLTTAIEWGRERGLHKLVLDVFPHNEAAISLYQNAGFVEEGRRVRHFRRANGELWDLLEMGLLL